MLETSDCIIPQINLHETLLVDGRFCSDENGGSERLQLTMFSRHQIASVFATAQFTITVQNEGEMISEMLYTFLLNFPAESENHLCVNAVVLYKRHYIAISQAM
jgi:hypothetical protein